MPLLIEGFSCLGAFGSGPEALLAALSGRAADFSATEFSPEVDTASLTRFIPARALRQCDRFSRMALLGACLALENAGIDPASLATQASHGAQPSPGESPIRYGIVLASGYGTATPTIDFINSILDFGEAMASPLAFSHSVHNIPAAIIAKSLQITGPCSTVCQREGAVAAALLLARGMLREGRADKIIFGALDEVTPTLAAITEKIVREKGARPGGGDIPTRRDRPVTDGAVFFCLSRNAAKVAGRVTSVSSALSGAAHDTANTRDAAVAARFLSGRVPPAERATSSAIDGGAAYGNIPVAQAFDCAAGLALLGLPENAGKRVLCVEHGQDLASVVTLEGGLA